MFGLGRVACGGFYSKTQNGLLARAESGSLAGDSFWGLELRANSGLVGAAPRFVLSSERIASLGLVGGCSLGICSGGWNSEQTRG